MVMATLNRPALEEKYLLPTRYKFKIPDTDATINKPPFKCITIYRAIFSYNVRFLVHLVIMEILNKYELVPAQILPTS